VFVPANTPSTEVATSATGGGAATVLASPYTNGCNTIEGGNGKISWLSEAAWSIGSMPSSLQRASRCTSRGCRPAAPLEPIPSGRTYPQPDRRPGQSHASDCDDVSPGDRTGLHRYQPYAWPVGRGGTGRPAGSRIGRTVRGRVRQRGGGTSFPRCWADRFCHALRRRPDGAWARTHRVAGFDVVGMARLDGVRKIYAETPARAYAIGRQADRPEAEAVFLSGTGMPTLAIILALDDDLGEILISAVSMASFVSDGRRKRSFRTWYSTIRGSQSARDEIGIAALIMPARVPASPLLPTHATSPQRSTGAKILRNVAVL
jgi:hypothetical protein